MQASAVSQLSITADEWQRVGALFDRLSTLPPEQRELDTLDEPPTVRTLLERMLRAHDTSDADDLDSTFSGALEALLGVGEEPEEPETRTDGLFGPWRARHEIGRGGMGIVLQGERADGQFDKQVAIKLLPAAGSRSERLREEIRILARLEHPHIAWLLDGGISDDGIPYLVMEFVQGLPIDRYCRERSLSPPKIALLFEQVVEAVRFAHRHLVVHCDLKPGNILVTDDGQVKLVDFGIAGLITTGADDDVPVRGLLCSPAYAAPEQLAGERPATSQDIFSLGAVFYQLLCGQRIRSAATATQLIFGGTAGETSPPAPSTFNSRIDGDLDAVCRRALANDPEQRYATASALLADLRRWRNHQPLAAREGGAVYRFGKWLQRNRTGAAMGLLAVVALVGGAAVSIWQAQRATTEAEHAQEQAQRATTIKEFLLSLLRAGDPLRVGGPVLDTREVLKLGAERIRGDDSLGLPVRLELLNTIADVQRTLDVEDEARGILEDAIALAEAGEQTRSLQHAETLLQLGLIEASQSNFEPGVDWFTRALAASENHTGAAADRLRARALIQRAGLRARFGQVPAAEEDLDIAASTIERIDPPDLELAMLLANTRGVAAYHVARYEEAFEYLRETADLHRRMGNKDQAGMVQTLSSLAAIATMLGRLDDALEYDTEAVAIARQTYPQGHRQIGNALFALGDTLRQLGRFEEAEARLLEGLSIQQAGGNDAEVDLIERALLRVLVARGSYAQAAELAANLRPRIEERWGGTSRHVLLVLEQQIAALMHLDDRISLERTRNIATERLAGLSETDRWVPLAQLLRWRLGHAALLGGDLGEAERWFEEGARAPEDSAQHPTPRLLLAGLGLRLAINRGNGASTQAIEHASELLDDPEAVKATASAAAYALGALVTAHRVRGDKAAAASATEKLKAMYESDRRLTVESRTGIRDLLESDPPTS